MLGYHFPLRVFFARVAMGNSFVPRDFCFLFVFVCLFVSVITVDNGSSLSFCQGYYWREKMKKSPAVRTRELLVRLPKKKNNDNDNDGLVCLLVSPYYFLVYNILLSPGSPGGGGFSLHTVAYTGRDYGETHP